MIGVVAGVGRIAMTNALRQVGRQFGREVVQRIMGGEAIEHVLTCINKRRDEIIYSQKE